MNSTPHPECSPRIVALGGGHGLYHLLRGLKSYTNNLTAIVTVADDGGSSGTLRKELSMPAPGDIRNCMQALSNAEPLLQQLMDYRFPGGSLAGQSFGNLFLAALNGISPSFDQAVLNMQQVLSITGQVLPVTADNVQLTAFFENGSSVVGESKIGWAKKTQNCRIHRVALIPPDPTPLSKALEAIHQADLILLGPGSLYTSLIPNLLIPGIADALRASPVPRIYLANLMTEEGETEGYTVGDHITALYAHGGNDLFTSCLVNSASIPDSLLRQTSEYGVAPVAVDRDQISALGIELFEHPLFSTSSNQICHSPSLLVQWIQEFYESRAIKLFPDYLGHQYVLEQMTFD
ncbi:MAG: YvcK family protein [Evtepia sp.]|nr:YvcK family protein [Evtepia sp.]